MELFDIVKNIFIRDKKKWGFISKTDKNRNFFMINRIMSIQYPIQANLFNKMRVTPFRVIDWWQGNLSVKYGKSPKWIFTSTNKKNSKTDKKSANVKDFQETEFLICSKFNVSLRDLDQIKKFYPEKYNEWIEDINDQLGLKK
jgi:hypothetical protein